MAKMRPQGPPERGNLRARPVSMGGMCRDNAQRGGDRACFDDKHLRCGANNDPCVQRVAVRDPVRAQPDFTSVLSLPVRTGAPRQEVARDPATLSGPALLQGDEVHLQIPQLFVKISPALSRSSSIKEMRHSILNGLDVSLYRPKCEVGRFGCGGHLLNVVGFNVSRGGGCLWHGHVPLEEDSRAINNSPVWHQPEIIRCLCPKRRMMWRVHLTLDT